MKDPGRVGSCVIFGGVSAVAFLPQELASPQKQSGSKLPTHHIRPLIQQERQVSIGLNPFGHVLADNRFRGGPHNHRLIEFLASAMSHDC
ncbi:unannotated protein [freshwater metagenome]|uniref:Unannotated protein n=1 Tax=freshwater metagenome TaxID=449393 RepID=A0A6J6QVK9_9ZZZZ